MENHKLVTLITCNDVTVSKVEINTSVASMSWYILAFFIIESNCSFSRVE